MSKKKRNYAYTDGSFNPETKVYGCGGFVVDQDGLYHYFQASGNDPSMAKMRNVAGEILGARKAVEKAIELGMHTLTIHYDYEGIANWPIGIWKCTKRYTKDYAEFIHEVTRQKLLTIVFKHVRGHSGNKENEEADRLAKEAVGL